MLEEIDHWRSNDFIVVWIFLLLRMGFKDYTVTLENEA